MSARAVVDAMSADLRHALRALARGPVYTLTAITTLAIGIGATTAAYSVAGSILLKPLPFTEPDRLVAVWSSLPRFNRISPSYPYFADFREQSGDLFDGIAFMDGDGALGSGARTARSRCLLQWSPRTTSRCFVPTRFSGAPSWRPTTFPVRHRLPY